MKKLIFIIIFIPLFVIVLYKFIEYIDYNSLLSNIEKYTFKENEKILKKFKYNNQNYIISKYTDKISSWGHLNILLKNNNDYYILKNIKKCDTVDEGTNLYIKNNEIYIHCIGKVIINKYIINNLNIEQENLNFDFKNTPNISQLHMNIDNVDNEYIYLSSPFKKDNTVNDEPRVKCSFNNKKCIYYF